MIPSREWCALAHWVSTWVSLKTAKRENREQVVVALKWTHLGMKDAFKLDFASLFVAYCKRVVLEFEGTFEQRMAITFKERIDWRQSHSKSGGLDLPVVLTWHLQWKVCCRCYSSSFLMFLKFYWLDNHIEIALNSVVGEVFGHNNRLRS